MSGLPQLAKAPPSRAHRTVAGSLTVNSNVALVALVDGGGPLAMMTTGAVMSGGATTVQTKLVVADWLPA